MAQRSLFDSHEQLHSKLRKWLLLLKKVLSQLLGLRVHLLYPAHTEWLLSVNEDVKSTTVSSVYV